LTRFTAAALISTALCSPGFATEPAEVMVQYADIAEAAYGDSLTTAKALQAAVAVLIAAPTHNNLAAAKAAWLAARVPYQQTEVYRFGNAVVDDWE